jgi:hypothetical protein
MVELQYFSFDVELMVKCTLLIVDLIRTVVFRNRAPASNHYRSCWFVLYKQTAYHIQKL